MEKQPCHHIRCCDQWKEQTQEFIKSKVAVYDSVIPLLGYVSEETRNTNSKEYMHLKVHCSIIYSSQGTEVTQVQISG